MPRVSAHDPVLEPLDQTANESNRVGVVVATVGAAAGAVLLVLALFRLSGGFGHGFDITDEGLYLQSVDVPGPQYAYVGLWAAYLQPVFALVHYSVFWYRAVGAGLLVLVALTLSAGVRGALAGGVADLEHHPVRVSPVTRICLDLAIVSGALTYYGLFLITPSYNWLALVGVLIAAAGLLPLLGVEQRRWRDAVAAFLLAFGCFLALMGRPLSGIGLGVLGAALVLVASARPFARRFAPLLVSVITLAVLGLIHLVFFVGWSDSLAITKRTQYIAANDQTGHTYAALIHQSIHQLSLVPEGVGKVAAWTPLLGLLPLVALTLTAERRQRIVGPLGAIAVLAVGVTIWLRDGFGGGPQAAPTLPFAGIALLLTSTLVLISAVLVDLAPGAGLPSRAVVVRAGRTCAGGGFLLAGAVLYAFTSNNGVITQMWGAFGIFAAACLVLLIGSLGPRHVPIVAAMMAVICGLAVASSLGQGADAGYRTSSVASSTVRVQVSARGATLLVAPEYAQALDALRTGAQAAGFQPGTPLVDLTPFTPGVGYLIGSEPPTTLVLGFAPSVAEWALAQQNQQQWHDAWVLVDAGGKRALPPEVMSTLGRSFPDDYELVTSATWPITPAAHLELWRPKTP